MKCQKCQKEIEADRLAVLPDTEVCAACAMAAARPTTPRRMNVMADIPVTKGMAASIHDPRWQRTPKTLRGKYGFQAPVCPLTAVGRKEAENDFIAQIGQS